MIKGKVGKECLASDDIRGIPDTLRRNSLIFVSTDITAGRGK
jgi:hypothetical protein